MVKVVALILVFADGYAGGHTTASYFWEKARCQEYGSRLALQYTNYGHPTSFFCVASTIPEKNKGIVRK